MLLIDRNVVIWWWLITRCVVVIIWVEERLTNSMDGLLWVINISISINNSEVMSDVLNVDDSAIS